jgi:hypothetical protein
MSTTSETLDSDGDAKAKITKDANKKNNLSLKLVNHPNYRFKVPKLNNHPFLHNNNKTSNLIKSHQDRLKPNRLKSMKSSNKKFIK